MTDAEIAGELVQFAGWRISDFAWEAPLDPRGGFVDWIRSLRGRSGAYMIRDKSSGVVLYCGESHTGRLYGTLTRHLQEWSGPGSRRSWDPHRVTIAVVLCSPDAAPSLQFMLIQQFRPEENYVLGDGGGPEYAEDW